MAILGKWPSSRLLLRVQTGAQNGGDRGELRDEESTRSGKSQLKRVVAMLTRLIQRGIPVAGRATEHEYRSAEYE